MKTDLIGSRRKPDRIPGRPPIPPADPRIEEAKSWGEPARGAARRAFEAASSSGATREEAIEAGYRAGLGRHREETEPPPAELVARATDLFGARVVDVLATDRDRSTLEERCFERLFPDQPPEPATPPAPPMRSGDREEDRPEIQRKALVGELSKAPTHDRQGSLFPASGLDARSA